jgi:hypothetical protein
MASRFEGHEQRTPRLCGAIFNSLFHSLFTAQIENVAFVKFDPRRQVFDFVSRIVRKNRRLLMASVNKVPTGEVLSCPCVAGQSDAYRWF